MQNPQTAPRRQKKGFRKFLDEILTKLLTSAEYHIIADNHTIHNRHEVWLESHPNVFFRYTPTYASWLNMVEIRFGIFSRQSFREKRFTSTETLCRPYLDIRQAYNQNVQLFIWKKKEVKGAQLKK